MQQLITEIDILQFLLIFIAGTCFTAESSISRLPCCETNGSICNSGVDVENEVNSNLFNDVFPKNFHSKLLTRTH